jgi:hypothetical protein
LQENDCFSGNEDQFRNTNKNVGEKRNELDAHDDKNNG